MIEARQRFLEHGFYQPIADTLNNIVLKNLNASNNVLDAGCGEGYYLRQLMESCPEQQSLSVLGLDISKPAILSAAKQNKQANWVVASNANIPVLSETIDQLICMFGFPVYPEFSRVLKPGGQLILVESGPNHLKELREIIYPVLKTPNEKKVEHQGFEMASRQTLSYDINLEEPKFIADLLIMTPHLFRASAEGKEKASKLSSLTLTIDVEFNCLTRV